MLLNNAIEKNNIDVKHNKEAKNLSIFFILENFIGTNYFIFNLKKIFNFLQNIFVQA